MTDQELIDLVASLAVGQAKTDAQLAKTDAQLAKTDKKLDRLAEMYGGIGENQGHAAEEFFYNSLKAKPELNGVMYDFIEKNVTRCKSGVEREFDILLVNGHDVSIIEVKYRAHPSDVVKLIEKQARDFKFLFSQYENYNVHLVLAALSMDDEVKQLALESGVTVLQRKGDLIETLVA